MIAEVLRRAADEIRQRAEAATPGPWRFGEFTSSKLGDHQIVYRADKDEQGKNWQVATLYGFSNPGVPQGADAAYIASWHPAVALAVAQWLDDSALAFCHRADNAGDCSTVPSGCTVHAPALAVACAYLGEAS